MKASPSLEKSKQKRQYKNNTSFGEFIAGTRHLAPTIDFKVPYVEKASFKINKTLARSKLSAMQVPLESSPSHGGSGFSPRMSTLNFGNGAP